MPEPVDDAVELTHRSPSWTVSGRFPTASGVIVKSPSESLALRKFTDAIPGTRHTCARCTSRRLLLFAV
jgi:hypothetical protein